MNHILFLNKYQPQLFNDFEIDTNIIHVLNTLIQMDSLNILFIGSVGTGKTALLNAVIREYYNNISIKQYSNNILHINSLKEQGINYYRNDMKTFCQTSSSIIGKKKIVVLDDLDLINEQSQQVFRNCIDKYKHNVHFISSCNNAQKVIESLQSRLIIIKIKPLLNHNLVHILHKIKLTENIIITPEAEKFILNVCNNSVKTLINYIEKFKLLNQTITIELVMANCTNISFQIFEQYTLFLKQSNITDAIFLFYHLHDKGYSVMDILDNYFLFVKTSSSILEADKYKIIPFICKYITAFHNIHEDEIELALFSNNLKQILKC